VISRVQYFKRVIFLLNLLLVEILVGGINVYIVKLILNETSLLYQQQFPVLNMIQIEMLELPY